MRVVIIVLVVIVVAFAIVVATGNHSGESTAADGAPPQNKDGSVDEDALEDWTPPSFSKMIAAITAPFAPGVELDNPRITLAPGTSASRVIPPSGLNLRVARIELMSGDGLRIEYDCRDTADRQCPQRACICRPGAIFMPLQVSSCPESWLKRRVRGNACTADDEKADKNPQVSLVVYPEPGTLSFAALGQSAVTAEVK